MRRDQFEHVVRAAAVVTGDELVVIGSQAIHAHSADLPAELVVSEELDVYPRSDPERVDLIDAALGQGSQFEEAFGYRAHGVGPETAIAPAGWEDRLVRVEVASVSGPPAVAWALDIHDLMVSKLVAGREEDYTFATVAIARGMVDLDELRRRAALLDTRHREAVARRIDGCAVRAAD